ncbi:MAG TPA: heavy-metal-associated domain-containing protein [Clostridia bacterium]|jgi:copper chaperone CopZ|nr:heavy-metal-associated domain-containing protein [Clostridia bacterium]
MKKVYRLNNLDCANCAAKMERNIAKIDGVTSVSVNFLAQKLTIEAKDECFEEVKSKMAAVVKKIEPDCEILGL